MRWLIVEDAMRDRRGHWFEYLSAFTRELTPLGDKTTLLVDRAAEPFLREQLGVQALLPASIWHRMGDNSGPLRRYWRVPAHALATFRAVKHYLNGNEQFDLIFVPTVLVHHLLGWTWLIKGPLKRTSSRILLFYPNTPIMLDQKTGEPSWQPAPTAKLFCRLIRSLRREVQQGRVILGVETNSMRESLTQLTGVPFTYFPHPVHLGKAENREPKVQPNGVPAMLEPSDILTFGSYGSARHEKGSDILAAAVEEYSRRYPKSRVRFILQNVDGDKKDWTQLSGNPRIQLIPRYFENGEYARHLMRTDVLLLPYRRSSYALRVSRVVIEAMVHGLPVVTTRGTTLEEQAREFGSAVLCDDENVESLVQAIHKMEQDFRQIAGCAKERMTPAQQHFSVKEFRSIFSRQLPCDRV